MKIDEVSTWEYIALALHLQAENLLEQTRKAYDDNAPTDSKWTAFINKNTKTSTHTLILFPFRSKFSNK